MEIDNAITIVLAKEKVISKNKLEKYVVETLKKEGIEGKIPTIKKYIGFLREANKIIGLTDEDKKELGIKEKDNRKVLLCLPETKSSFKHYDKVFKALDSKDIREKETALIELESIKTIKLNPHSLSLLVNALLNQEPIIYEKIIRILRYNFDNMVFPKSLVDFQNNMIQIIKKEKKIDTNTKYHIIWMLGILGNEAVIDFLKDDVKKGYDPDTMRNLGYKFWSVANLIVSHKTDLFEFQKSLTQEQNKVMFGIRETAENNIAKFRRKILEYENLFEGVKK